METELQIQFVSAVYAVGKLLAVFGAAWGLGQLVRTQLKELRLERASKSGSRAFAWPALFGTLTFWATLLLGVAWVARGAGFEGSAVLLEALFQLVAAGIAATVAIIVTTTVGATAISVRRATTVRLSVFLGVLTITAIFLGASTAIVWLALLFAMAAVAVVLWKPAGRARAAAVVADVAAGVRLFDLNVVGQEVRHDGRRLHVLQRGWVRSKLEDAGGTVMMRNEDLHGLILTQSVDSEPGGDDDDFTAEQTER